MVDAASSSLGRAETPARRVLFLSLYYPPDLCAGSFRAQALSKALVDEDSTLQIDVLTGRPSRYASFSPEFESTEQAGRVTVRRLALPSGGSGMLFMAYLGLVYAWRVLRTVRHQDYDLVVATSSRLLTALLGTWIACRKKARLYLDIRDIFVETLGDLYPQRILRPVVTLFDRLERWAVGRADKVNLVSRGFAPWFEARYSGREFSFFTNGVDGGFSPATTPVESEGPVEVACKKTLTEGRLHILYAGNVGDGQALHRIVPALAKQLAGRAILQVVGDGGRHSELVAMLARERIDNVELMAPVPRDRLQELYRQADVLFLHLDDKSAFRRVLPSKLFEYAATGKPVLAGVAGYAAEFVQHEVPNAAVFSPLDVDGALEALARLELVVIDRSAFIDRYDRRAIMRGMARDICELL